MSTFGGPDDTGVAPDEGLALVTPAIQDRFSDVLLPEQPPGTTGLARRLDPATYYIACRWNYTQTPASHLRSVRVKVTNPKNGKTLEARPVDWGPALWTGRVTDLSPGLAEDLNLVTDQECRVEIPLPPRVASPFSSEDAPKLSGHVLDARPDTIDFRDRFYIPTLTEVPVEMPLANYLHSANPIILDQGSEGACTGFGLAAVSNYLLSQRQVYPDRNPVSARMLYEMARRYDEWEGEDYSGSSARGAMKGWHKHGVCSEEHWPYLFGDAGGLLTEERAGDARQRPLGAYFRVNHQDVVAMHAAITEVGILYATAYVHSGWQRVGSDGVIHYSNVNIGGHAFAIVGYDDGGFWIQNSWGEDWGRSGFAYISYDDWLENGKDVWVARLGAPVRLKNPEAVRAASFTGTEISQVETSADLRPHLVTVGNDGALGKKGQYANDENDIGEIFRNSFPRITKDWKAKRILLYAHGGLVGADGAIQRVANYRQTLLDNEVYPLAFIWNSDFWSTIKNILKDALSKRKEEGGPVEGVGDFLLDRLDDSLEPIARLGTGKAQWTEMKENALMATQNSKGAARAVLKELRQLVKSDPDVEIHVAGHSAGSIFMGPIVAAITGTGKVDLGEGTSIKGLEEVVKSCTLWAPACTIDLFNQYYEPSLDGGVGRRLREFAVYNLTDSAEQNDHCAHIYHKSLLYLVSNALEEEARIPFFRDGTPLLGMEKFIEKDSELKKLFRKTFADLVLSPGGTTGDPLTHSTSQSHGGFDDDGPTLKGLLARIEKASSADSSDSGSMEISFQSTAAGLSERRSEINRLI